MQVFSNESGLTNGACVTIDGEDQIWGVGMSGKISKLDIDSAETHFSLSTKGLPVSIAIDSKANVFVADVEHAVVMKLNQDQTGFDTLVREYEGSPLLGPSSIAVNDNEIFFTDSGPLGESNPEVRKGSVFCIERDEHKGQILKPLALSCLAHPCGICVNGPNVYVAEMLLNRIVRFSRRPHGTYVMSVLHQFSGRIGPSAITCDKETGLLYVARFEFDSEVPGLISVIDPSGANGGHIRDIEIPELDGCEITGLSILQEARTLYIFESSRGGKIAKLEI